MDEDLPRRPRRLEPPPLDVMSVEELRSYVAELQAEIARTETAIAAKHGHRDIADSVFKRPT